MFAVRQVLVGKDYCNSALARQATNNREVDMPHATRTNESPLASCSNEFRKWIEFCWGEGGEGAG